MDEESKSHRSNRSQVMPKGDLSNRRKPLVSTNTNKK